MKSTYLPNTRRNSSLLSATTGLALCCFLLTSCGGSSEKRSDADSVATKKDTTNAIREIKPSGPAPEWAPDMNPEMQAVIEKLASYQDKPIPELTAQQARMNHTPTNAVMDLIKDYNIPVPAPMVDTAGKDIPVKGGNIHLRIYTPKAGAQPFPVIVYYHGGGFVIADLDTYDASARGLAEQTGAVVVSVAYRLAPEHKFPTAHEDAYAAYLWTLNNTATIKGDAKRIAVAGESAGGNLAANVSIMARDKGAAIPVHQLLVYPVAGSDMNTKSYQKYAAAKPLDKPMMGWFVKNYLNNMGEAKDTRISLVNANLKGLPSTTIITAEIDPLQSDGVLLEEKLKDAKIKVDSKNFKGVTHEFFGMSALVPQAKEAQAYATNELKKVFTK